jgi:hypothetical protein
MGRVIAAIGAVQRGLENLEFHRAELDCLPFSGRIKVKLDASDPIEICGRT